MREEYIHGGGDSSKREWSDGVVVKKSGGEKFVHSGGGNSAPTVCIRKDVSSVGNGRKHNNGR